MTTLGSFSNISSSKDDIYNFQVDNTPATVPNCDNPRQVKTKEVSSSDERIYSYRPEAASNYSKSSVKKIGPYFLGPQACTSPVKCLNVYIARKENTNQYFTLKVLLFKHESEKETVDDTQGKVLLHTEYTLLKYLESEEGVIGQHGLYKSTVDEEIEQDGKLIKTGRKLKRFCLVLDCYTPHDFSPRYRHLFNLQQYVIKEKKLSELESLQIFYKIVKIVTRLHQNNIVHRDLKLGNITMNHTTGKVTITNFCLGKNLCHENVLLSDQRGSPAYIAPEILSGKQYLGKPCDVWALGVMLYTMVYGQFPFYDQTPNELFRKIRLAQYEFPQNEKKLSSETTELIRSMLVLDPKKRPTAGEIFEKTEKLIDGLKALQQPELELQVVPECNPSDAFTMPCSSCGAHTRKRTMSQVEKAELDSLVMPETSRSEEDERVVVYDRPSKVARRSCVKEDGGNMFRDVSDNSPLLSTL